MLEILKNISLKTGEGHNIDLEDIKEEVIYIKEYVKRTNIKSKEEFYIHLSNLEKGYGEKLPYKELFIKVYNLMTK